MSLQHPVHRRWVCRGCGELIDGPFEAVLEVRGADAGLVVGKIHSV
jgi:hypothetical protein